MKILVVADKLQVVKSVEKALKDLNAGFEIIGSTKTVPESFEQAVKDNPVDMILINTNHIDKNSSSEANCGFRSTLTVTTPVQDYTFEAFRIRKNLKETFLQAAGVKHNTHDKENPIFAETPTTPRVASEAGNAANAPKYRQRFFVKQGQRYHSIEIQEISYFFSEDRFIFLKTKDNQKYLVEYRIDQLEQMLDPSQFFRVNRAYLVAISSIKQVHSYPGNRLQMYLDVPIEKDLIVSRERVSDFRIWMGE